MKNFLLTNIFKELLKDEYEEADVKTEAKEELEDSFPVLKEQVVVKTEQTVEALVLFRNLSFF